MSTYFKKRVPKEVVVRIACNQCKFADFIDDRYGRQTDMIGCSILKWQWNVFEKEGMLRTCSHAELKD